MYRVAGEHAMAVDEATTAANLRYGGSGQPQDNQAHLNDLQNLANTMEALPRRGGRWTVGSTAAPWTAALMLAVTTLQGAKLDKEGTRGFRSSPRLVLGWSCRLGSIRGGSSMAAVIWREKEGAVRANPMKSRPKPRSGGTYG